MIIHVGNVRFKLFPEKRSGGRVYWACRWSVGGRRGRFKRVNLEAAKKEAERIAKSIAQGRSAERSPQDWASLDSGIINLDGTGLTVARGTALTGDLFRPYLAVGVPTESIPDRLRQAAMNDA